MRVLPNVRHVAFDIPTETFTVRMTAGAESGPVLAAIEDLGYQPEILDEAPEKHGQIERLRAPTSAGLEAALARAKARGVLLVVDFGGPFCRLCRLFETTSLEDERVLKELKAVEFVRIDVEADPAAAKDLDVHGVPDFWAFDGDGRVLARNNGYLDPEAFLAFLEGLRR